VSGPHFYLAAEVCDLLKMKASTFLNLKAQGKLPFLHEIRPRLGKHARYKAEPVDRYLRGEWTESAEVRRPSFTRRRA
jgi:hypothetical protein